MTSITDSNNCMNTGTRVYLKESISKASASKDFLVDQI
jgi:hypothetical protein